MAPNQGNTILATKARIHNSRNDERSKHRENATGNNGRKETGN